MAKPGGIRSRFTESLSVVLVNSNWFPRVERKPQRLQWKKDFNLLGIYRCFLKNGVFCQGLVWLVAIEALFFSLLEIRFFPGRTTDNKIGGESLGPSFCIARWLETLQPLGRPCGKEVGVWLLCYHWYSCMMTMALSNILSVFERLKRQWGRISVPRNTTTFCSRLLDSRCTNLKFVEQLGLILRMRALIFHLNSLCWRWCCEFGGLEFLKLGVVFPHHVWLHQEIGSFLGKMGGALRLHISISLLRPCFFSYQGDEFEGISFTRFPITQGREYTYHHTWDMEVVMSCGCWFSNSCRPSFWKHSWKLCWCTY